MPFSCLPVPSEGRVRKMRFWSRSATPSNSTRLLPRSRQCGNPSCPWNLRIGKTSSCQSVVICIVMEAITKRTFERGRGKWKISQDQRWSLGNCGSLKASWIAQVLNFPKPQLSFQENGDNDPFLESLIEASQETSTCTLKKREALGYVLFRTLLFQFIFTTK